MKGDYGEFTYDIDSDDVYEYNKISFSKILDTIDVPFKDASNKKYIMEKYKKILNDRLKAYFKEGTIDINFFDIQLQDEIRWKWKDLMKDDLVGISLEFTFTPSSIKNVKEFDSIISNLMQLMPILFK